MDAIYYQECGAFQPSNLPDYNTIINGGPSPTPSPTPTKPPTNSPPPQLKKYLSLLRFPAIKLQPFPSENNNNNNPKLIIGRIGGIVSELKSPHTNEICAFYRLDIQTQSSTTNEWEQKYTEVKCSDFYLVNPEYPKEKLYLCGTEYVVEIISKTTDMPCDGFHSLTSISDQMQGILQKAGISNTSNIRFREIKSEVNSQLGVFGVVEIGHPS